MYYTSQGLKVLSVETIDLIKEGGDDKLSSTDLRKKQLGEYRHVKVSKHFNIMDVVIDNSTHIVLNIIQ